MARRASVAQPAAAPAAEEVPGEELQQLFGANFRAARTKAGLSQERVAELSGIAQRRISKMELGTLNITLKTMDRLARVLDTSVTKLLAKGPAPRP